MSVRNEDKLLLQSKFFCWIIKERGAFVFKEDGIELKSRGFGVVRKMETQQFHHSTYCKTDTKLENVFVYVFHEQCEKIINIPTIKWEDVLKQVIYIVNVIIM